MASTICSMNMVVPHQQNEQGQLPVGRRGREGAGGRRGAGGVRVCCGGLRVSCSKWWMLHVKTLQGSVEGMVKTFISFLPSVNCKKNIRCDVDENLWPNRKERVDGQECEDDGHEGGHKQWPVTFTLKCYLQHCRLIGFFFWLCFYLRRVQRNLCSVSVHDVHIRKLLLLWNPFVFLLLNINVFC